MCRWDKPEGGSWTADTAGTAGTVGTGSSLSMKGISLSLMSLTALSIYEYNQLVTRLGKVSLKFNVFKA